MKRLTIFFCILTAISCNRETDYRVLFNSAKEKTDNGKYDEAIDILDDIIKIKPDFDSAYVERAYNYLQIDKPEDALEDINKAIKINYKNISAYFIRGMIYEYLYNFDRALTDYTHIISLRDSIYLEAALRERANIYYLLNEIEFALNDLTKIIEMDSLNFEAYVSIGIVKMKDNVYEKYSDSIDIAMKDTNFYNQFFKYYTIMYSFSDNNFNQNAEKIMYDYRGALQDFNKAIQINPNYDFAFINRANVYIEIKEFDKALKDLNKAIELNSCSENYFSRAMFYKNQKENEKSLSDFNKSIELDSKNSLAYTNRGYLKEEQLKDFKGAKKDFEMAKKIEKENF